MPDDAELEAAGAVIGRIDIDIRDIFDEGDPRENVGLFRLADQLHIRTRRSSSIQAQLLFASGEKYKGQNSPKPNATCACCSTSTTRGSCR